MSMKPGARTRPRASSVRSPGDAVSLPIPAMRSPRMRNAPPFRSAPLPSASCALTMSRVSDACGAREARKESGAAREKVRVRKTPHTARRENGIRLASCSQTSSRENLGRAGDTAHSLLALGTGAEMVPDDEENYRGDQDERRDGVDFRSDTAAKAAPDFQRQRVVAADEEEGDGDFVHGEREDEQTSGDKREPQMGESDKQKRPPRSRAEI